MIYYLKFMPKIIFMLFMTFQIGQASEWDKLLHQLPPHLIIKASHNPEITDYSYDGPKKEGLPQTDKERCEVKSLIINDLYSSGRESLCSNGAVWEFIQKLPNLESLALMCLRSDYVSLHPLPKLNKLAISTESESLSAQLNLKDKMPKLKTLYIHSNQLAHHPLFFEEMAKLPHLEEVTLLTFRACLDDNSLDVLAHHPTLKKVNFKSYENTGGYTVLIDLYEEREKTGRPPLLLGRDNDNPYNFSNSRKRFGNFTLSTPQGRRLFKE